MSSMIQTHFHNISVGVDNYIVNVYNYHLKCRLLETPVGTLQYGHAHRIAGHQAGRCVVVWALYECTPLSQWCF